jgi:FkbM family methyltransferase
MTLLDKILARFVFYCKSYYNLYIKRDRHSIEVRRWHRDNDDFDLRLNYQLSENSVVFDVGAYKGDWAWQIAKKYNCHIYAFEPVPEFYSQIVDRFKHNNKVRVFNFGLADTTKRESLSLNDEGSSIFKSGNSTIQVQLRDIQEFLNDTNIHGVDLIKINIEG